VKSKLSIFAWSSLLSVALLVASSVRAGAQEGEPIVLDSVIAQVNADVITLSMLKREMKDAVEAFKQQGATEQKANEEITRRQPELIASLINEMLLIQKGKELNIADDVEAEVNREMLRVAKQQGFTSLQDMENAMRREGVDPVGVRQTLRTQYMKNAVLTREVDSKIYFGITGDEARKYYDRNREKLRKPEVVTISEIFLSLAGKPEAEVRARGAQLLEQLRAGGDFKALAATHSEREINGQRVGAQSGGKIGTFPVTDLKPEFAAAIKNVPVGKFTDLVRTDEGFEILRVDERVASSDAYDEDKVREFMTVERRDKERLEFMKGLRKDAYIKIAESYRATVEPLLNAVSTPGGTANSSTPPASTNSTPNGNKKP
jgi:parvulin-like peptidyl-prolyl isomerase